MSKVDQLYRTILQTKFFVKGWGDSQTLKRLFEKRHIFYKKDQCHKLVEPNHPIHIDKEEQHSDYDLLEGHFRSPFADVAPGVVPEESEIAYFQMILPKQWKTDLKPVCLQLAGTGDHYFWRRRNFMAKPLAKEGGIASIILENPFYGLRKPKAQTRSSLHNVTDIFVMGGCLAMESIALFRWCLRNGYGPLGVTGISMGGHMASIAACSWPHPIALIPCLSWTTASCVFTQGVMSGGVPWQLLQDQYFKDCIYYEELKTKIRNLEDDDAFRAGWAFSENYPTKLQADADGKVQAINAETAAAASPASADGGAWSKVTSILPEVWPTSGKKDSKECNVEALQFMRGIMDEFTHLENFPRPRDPNLVVIVTAEDDAYVLRDGITDLTKLWPGSQLRSINTGHVGAFVFKQGVFRKAIIDAFDKMIKSYHQQTPAQPS